VAVAIVANNKKHLNGQTTTGTIMTMALEIGRQTVGALVSTYSTDTLAVAVATSTSAVLAEVVLIVRMRTLP
jgi:hypothetical protein